MPGRLIRSKDVVGDSKSSQLFKAKTWANLDIHQQHWNQTIGYTLSMFLNSAEYDQPSQSRILAQFSQLVAPNLGSSPVLGEPQWKSFMTDNHCPVELSWDFHTGTSQPTIRYSVEPIDLDAGTVLNPYNDNAATNFKEQTVKVFPGTDTTLFDHFQAYFNGKWTGGKPEGHHTTMFWAFDLKQNATTNKAYFFPGIVAHASNMSTLEVVADAISSSPGCSPETIGSFTTFADFVNQRKRLNLEIDMLALDLAPLEKSRLKVYFRDRRTDFRSIREMMSLGGLVRGREFDVGIKNLKTLWSALLGMNGVSEDVPLPHKDHRTAGILYNVEFCARSTVPKIKIYIPVRHYAKSDSQIIEALASFLADQVDKQPDVPVDQPWIKQYSNCLHDIL
ncbi:Tryptophan dimethylallyltransferase 1 [Fusarium austroafricanum]|uniref:Tryptophan dimethylallyltransferase 1 n=1 Tax=Fusarium austroafricanum TaxID=2364996 RepID=A0A8H4P0D2_9HYPO|nr:Tryptophan dimethylallyltransferase 1 [Fusarium austroafricanum]